MNFNADRMDGLRTFLETRQISLYFAVVVIATAVALLVPGTTVLEVGINPALAVMLLVTFLQVPLADIWKAFSQIRFLMALVSANFILLPVLVAALFQFLPADAMIQLGVLLVLLTPCIDYVVTFSHLGHSDAKLLLSATPALLVLQMVLLPLYLGMFLGESASDLVRLGPFVDAFVWLIAVPLVLAGLVQLWASRAPTGKWLSSYLTLLPVPATGLVLFLVVAAVVPQVNSATNAALRVVPIYMAFAVAAPIIGWGVGNLFRLGAPARRAIAFSAATRNSLVVLPLALAVPGAIPVLPAVIVTQTLIELISELFYVRVLPKLINA